MSAKQLFIFNNRKRLKEVVAERLNLGSNTLEATLLTPDSYGEVWRLETRDTAYIARLGVLSTDLPYLSAQRSIQGVALEPVRLRLINERTSVPVPHVYFFEPHCSELNCTLTLTEHLPGRHLHFHNQANWNSLVRAYGRSIGKCLKAIHGLHRNQFGQEGNAIGLHDSWAEVCSILWKGLIQELCDDAALAQQSLEVYERLRPLFEGVSTASLLHGNLHAFNVLLDPSGMVTGIIDWVDSIWGDPLWDLTYIKYQQALGVNFYLEYPEAKALVEGKAGLVRGRFYWYFIYLEQTVKIQKDPLHRKKVLQLILQKLGEMTA